MNNKTNIAACSARRPAGAGRRPWLGIFFLCLASSAWAAEFNLRAEATLVVMPDGVAVPVWGFALDSAPGAGDGVVSVPGPVLRVNPRDPHLRIRVENHLPAPISLVIPGQKIPESYHLRGPFIPTSVSPVRNADGRARSFTEEVPPGSYRYFVWYDPKPGTFLYQSGTHQAVQVQMGLFGAIRIDADRHGAAEAYPNHPYDKEVFLILSELDPRLHEAVAQGRYGPGQEVTSTLDYRPQYFLVNGQPFQAGRRPIPASEPGERLLLRVLNAGINDHVLAFPGLNLSLQAEDGALYPYPKAVDAVMLPAGKTADIWTVLPRQGYYPLWDRRLALTNGPRESGGMLAYLQAGLDRVPLRLATAGEGVGVVRVESLPGGPTCSDQCEERYLFGTTLTLAARAGPGSVFRGWLGLEPEQAESPTITVTMDRARALTALFEATGGEHERR